MSLFSLATGVICDVLDLQVQADASRDAWLDVYSSALELDDGVQDQTDSNWLLHPGDLDLVNVAAWLDRVDLLGPLPPGVADLTRANLVSLDTQVLQLTSIAEGVHRALYPRQKQFEKKIAKDVQELATEAIRDKYPDLITNIRGLLGFLHQPSYSERIARLAKEIATSVPGVTGDTDEWKRAVTKARNQYAHRLRGEFLKSETVDRDLTVALSLRWLLTGLFLLQAGISPEMLSQRFRMYQRYTNFLSSASEWQPTIYR